jgi:hypothetical protein
MKLPLFAAVICLYLSGCGTEAQPAESPLEGFTRTDDGGRVITNDPADWITQEVYRNEITVRPPYPNPTTNGLLTLLVQYPLSYSVGRVDFFATNVSGNPVIVFTEPAAPQGSKVYSLNMLALSPTGSFETLRGRLLRLRLRDGQGRTITYGDIQFE